jgi:hypothetical protein
MRSSADTDGGAAPHCQVLVSTGMLGYGVDEDLIAYESSKLVPAGVLTDIILDSGSTDSGPETLRRGATTCLRVSYLKGISALLRLVH